MQAIIICSTRRIGYVKIEILVKIPFFGPFLAHFRPEWAHMSPKNFAQTTKSRLIDTRHCNQSKYAISEESDLPKSRYQPKPHFWAQFGPKWASFGPKYFLTRNDRQYHLNIMPVFHNLQNCGNLMI